MSLGNDVGANVTRHPGGLLAIEEKWAGLMTMPLAQPGGYNLNAPTTSTAAQQRHVHFAHREEPKLL